MLNFEEQYIPDEKERLRFLLEQYLPFLLRHATPSTLENHEFITRLLKENTPHSELLAKIEPIFTTKHGKPKPLIPGNNIESKLGPNRSAEYFGIHADICFMVTQNIRKDK